MSASNHLAGIVSVLYNRDMARVFLVLLLALWVGAGYAGTPFEGPCVADDCESGDAEEDHGADAGDLDADDCPPACGNCLRLAVDTTPRVALAEVTQLPSEAAVASPPPVPPPAPSVNGLFRPPRA